MLFILRHGQTDWNLNRLFQGTSNIPLNETGRQQAREMNEKLKDIKFDIVFASPLDRAVETAKIVSGKEDIIKDQRLTEKAYGTLEGTGVDKVWEIVNSPNYVDSDYGVEPYSNVKARTHDFLREILEKYKGQNVLVVTHGGASMFLRSFFEGEPEDGNISKLMLKNCEIYTHENS